MTRPSNRPPQALPWGIGVPALLGAILLVVPLIALIARVPWAAIPHIVTTPVVRDALSLSLLCATTATLISVVLGIPLAWVLAHVHAPGMSALRALITVPLVLPPVVGGVALMMAFGRMGVFGRHLDAWTGVTLPFTTAGVVLAETFVAMPFLVVSVEGALRSANPGYREAAATLGATPWTIFRRVTLPMIGPAIVSGGVLCWARALGEFGATITFAGNYPGRTQTMPLAVYEAMESDPDAALALSLVLLLVAVAVLLVMRSPRLSPQEGAA